MSPPHYNNVFLLVLGRGRILIPGFIRSPPTLAVYDVANSLPRGGVGRDFPFTEDETRRHFSYLSGTFRELYIYIYIYIYIYKLHILF